MVMGNPALDWSVYESIEAALVAEAIRRLSAEPKAECQIRPHSLCSAGTCEVCVDAARYRWLKENHLQTGTDSWIRTGDDLEEAIDEARRAES